MLYLPLTSHALFGAPAPTADAYDMNPSCIVPRSVVTRLPAGRRASSRKSGKAVPTVDQHEDIGPGVLKVGDSGNTAHAAQHGCTQDVKPSGSCAGGGTLASSPVKHSKW